MEKINLIWQTSDGDQTNFELEYTTGILFKNFEVEKYFDNGKLDLVLDNSVIIYSNNSNDVSDEFKNYLNKFIEKNYTFYLLHWSNENLGHNTEYYQKANHVFRPYFDEKIKEDNVTFIPLGVKSGFLSEESIMKEKVYTFAFIGQPKSDREEVINIVKKFDGFVHTTNQWNCPTSIDQNSCKEIYSKTKFIPCPMGWVNPDSYRIMESLESGSIPVVKNYNNLSYFRKVWGFNPIPVVNSWDELSTLNSISDDEYKLLYNTVFNWYNEFKILLSKKIENKVIESKSIKKTKILKSFVHFITPLYRKNNIRIVYSNIFNLLNDFNWHLIEGSKTIGEESLDFLNSDKRVYQYKIDTNFEYGHEQRNYFIKNIKCNDRDWCYFLDDDNIVTQDLIDVLSSEKDGDIDVILFSQKKGLTEKIRLYGYEGHLKLGSCDIGSFAIRYGSLKNTEIPYEDQRNSDGHYAEQIARIENLKIKYESNKFTRYNSLSFEIT